MIQATVKIDLSALHKFKEQVDQDLRGSGNGPIRAALKQWAARYRSFVQERFDTYSRGGGNWPPLSPRTIAARRGKRQLVSILRDTGILYAALNPTFVGKPGSVEEGIPFGVRVGYGGPGKHPGGKATIADIAKFHNDGAGHLPKREIIVPPPENVLNAMAGDMERALKKLSEDIT